MRLFMGINGWIARGIHLAARVYGCMGDDLVIPVQIWSVLLAEAYVNMYSLFLFPRTKCVYRPDTGYDFFDMPRRDRGGRRVSRRRGTLRGWRGGTEVRHG